MSDAVQALRREVDDMRKFGRTPSEVVLELTLVHARPELAQTIWYCAIPRWFNLEIIKALRSRGDTDTSPQNLLNELLDLPFVRDYPPFGYAYSAPARQLLLERWRTEDPSSYISWNRRAQSYFERRLRTTTTSRLLPHAVKGAVVLSETDRNMFLRELNYHTLIVDPEKGFQEFQVLFRAAERSRQFSEMRALLSEVESHTSNLSGYRQIYVRYYDGVLSLRMGQLDRATAIFTALLSQIGPSRLQSKLYYRMGELSVAKDATDEALSWYERCLAACGAVNCHPWEFARVLRDLGSVYQDHQDWDRAEQLFLRSLDEWQRIGDDLGVIETYNDLGTLYLNQKRPNKALKCYQESLKRLEVSSDQWRIARIYNNLGNYYADQKQWDQAVQYFNRSLEVKSHLGDTFGVGASYYNLGNVYLGQGREQGSTQPLTKKAEALLAKATECYEISLRNFQLVGDRPILAQTLYYLASTYRVLGLRERALQCIDDAIGLYRSLRSEDLVRAEELRIKLISSA